MRKRLKPKAGKAKDAKRKLAKSIKSSAKARKGKPLPPPSHSSAPDLLDRADGHADFHKTQPREAAEETEKEAAEVSKDYKRKWEREGLTTRQSKFAVRYAIHSNGARACRESGYNENNHVALLKNPRVVEVIEEWKAARAKKWDLTADRVIGEIVKLAFGNLDDFLQVDEDGTPIIDCSVIGRDEMTALSEITQERYVEGANRYDAGQTVKKTKIKLYDKLRALELLGKNFGLFDAIKDGEDGEGLSKAQKIRIALKAMLEADGDGKKE